MEDLQRQIAALRERIARIAIDCDEKHARARPPRARRFVEECLSGQEIETPFGRHFEMEKLYECHRRHGCADIGALADLPRNLFDSISGGTVPDSSPQEWAFLDTETTGLAGSACAFLVGVGRITRQGFHVRQFFMRERSEEASLLDAVSRHLAPFRVLITYNGRAFDQPLLETRYRLNRARPPFDRLKHLDLLYGARRLWKLRFESCRLVDLENEVLGVEREGDVPGALIPFLYFEYLRTREAARILPIFDHNATDILTLACLGGIVPYAFSDPAGMAASPGAPKHATEVLGMARWLRQAGELERALTLFRRAAELGLPDRLLFPALWDAGLLEYKLGRAARAIATWTDLAARRNPFRVRALLQLAKHYEHRENNDAMALEMTRAALAEEDSPDLRKRERRLRARLSKRGKR